MARKPKKENTITPEGTPPEEVEELEEMPGGVKIKRGRGRPVYKYNPQYAIIAGAMLSKGATIAELARAFGIENSTVWRWRQTYPEFDNAFTELGSAYDDRLERTLAERAAGYSYPVQKPVVVKGQLQIVEYWEHAVPDIAALKYWLMVRRPDKWRVKEEIALTGDEAFREILQRMTQPKEEKKDG